MDKRDCNPFHGSSKEEITPVFHSPVLSIQF
jgi:hypothetical protein